METRRVWSKWLPDGSGAATMSRLEITAQCNRAVLTARSVQDSALLCRRRSLGLFMVFDRRIVQQPLKPLRTRTLRWCVLQPCAPCHGPFSESLSTIGQPGRIVVCPCARSQCRVPGAGCRNPASRSSRARDGRMPGLCRRRGWSRPGRRRPGRGRSGPARAQHLLHSVTCRGSPRIEARLLCELDIVQDAAQRGIIPKFARLLHLGAAVSNSEP